MNSISTEKDPRILESLIKIHATPNPYIFDATFGRGVMWKGCEYFPQGRMDKRVMPNINFLGDFRIMEGVTDSSVDVLVFDPPHLPNHVASKNSSKIWEDRYGLSDDGEDSRNGDNVCDLFIPFLVQAKRVLKSNGILLTKICDLTHNHRYQWQQVDFVNCVLATNMTPCDMVIKHNPTKLKSSKWQNQYHVLKVHSYWIVVRPGKSCERKHHD